MKMKEKILQSMILELQKKKRLFSAITSILAGILIFEGIVHLLNQMYAEEDEWYRILWHYFYEDAGKIDNVYLGSSHVYCDLDPTILDRLNGQYNFNLSSPGQLLNGSYYLLREADRTNELSHVYLELYYVCNYDDTVFLEYYRNWMNTDYMKPSVNRASYMLAIGGQEQYLNIIYPFSRYRINLGDWSKIKGLIERKESKMYADYENEWEYGDGNGKCTYERQGFQRCTRIYKDSQKFYPQMERLMDYSIGERNEKYCRDMIEYCKKEEIPITLFVSPIFDLQLISTEGYDDYNMAIRELAAEYDVPFYDFNLAKDAYLPIQDGKYFRDVGHLNQYGAQLFTPFFYEVVSREEEDNKEYFYNTYKERLGESKPSIYGLYVKTLNERKSSQVLQIAANREFGIEYRITLIPDGEKRKMIQDFKEKKEFRTPLEEHGVCIIVARLKDNPVEMQTMAIRY